MFYPQRLILGILPLVGLTVAPSLELQVKAHNHHGQESLVAIANKRETLKSGKFETVKARTSGEVRLVREGNGRLFLVFNRRFRTEEGPDLFVVLTNEDVRAEPSGERKVLYTVSPLLRLKGEQSYILPGDFDPDEYQTVAIWCRQMNVILGAASLKNE